VSKFLDNLHEGTGDFPLTGNPYVDGAVFITHVITGLFKDTDYPFASVWIKVTKGRCTVNSVNVLDGTDSTKWRTLGNNLAANTNAQLDRLGLLNNPGVHSPSIVIGQASGRPGSLLGTGYFVGIGRGSFKSGADFTELSSIARAAEIWLRAMDDEIKGLPADTTLFGDDDGNTTTTINNQAALDDALARTQATLDASLSNTTAILENSVRSIAENNALFETSITGIIDAGLSSIFSSSDGLLNDAITTITNLSDASILTTERNAVLNQDRIANVAEQAILAEHVLHNDFLLRAVNVLDNIDAASQRAEADFRNIFVKIMDAILEKNFEIRDNVLSGIGNAVNGVLEVIVEGLPKAGDVIPGATQDVVKVLEKIRDVLHLPEITITPEGWENGTNTVFEEIRKVLAQDPDETDKLEQWLFESATAFQLDPARCRDRFTRPDDPENMRENFIFLVANIISALMFPLQIATARATGCLQQWAKTHPYLELQPGDAALAHMRGLIDKPRALAAIRAAGFAAEDDAVMLDIAKTLPDLELATSMLLRGIIRENDFTELVLGLGFDASWLPRFKEAMFFIPPAQDLITMSVREAFTPATVAEFGQDDDFPDDFLFYAKQQGISEFWAHKYWQAHWVLPSVQMGFEMLHRRIISPEKLKRLMTALDIMPGWIDDLTKISFNPYTRVDIRRMHKVGVLDENEVFDAYLDIGYDQDRARKLTDFTLKLNNEDETLASDLADDLTRSNILGFYSDGTITREAAQGLLLNAGYNLVSIGLFLTDVDFKNERADRKAEIAIVIEQAKIGNLSIDEARARLDSLGLETAEREKALIQLERVIQANVKRPSKADLDKFIANDIITRESYRENMGRLGYSDFWIDKYEQLAVRKVKNANE